MATYLQGVTDYIPDFQPFQPDYNFYMNVLQTKQNQYDRNYNALNNLYGELYHQRVTRDDSNKMKDDYLKKVDFELKRVSALDLSLEQNVQQAEQVFKPLYENKHLMKDMALTKNYDLEKGKAMALQNSKDVKQREMYWDVGIKDMDYRIEEFKNISKDDVLTFSNISYTPNVNVYEKYKTLSKDLNIDITLPDKSGMYLVRQKNGDLIIPSLQKLFLSTYASDPAIQKKYATEAYVRRKDDIKQRASKYNNNELLAEQEFLKEKYIMLKDYVNQKTKDSEDAEESSTTKKAIVENDVQTGNVNPRQPAFIEKINQAVEVDKIVYAHNAKLNDEINSTGSSLYEAKPVGNVDGLDLNNIELARQIVDSNYASYLAESDIISYASILSERDKIVDYKVNQVGLEERRHMHNLQRDANNNNFALRRDQMKFNNDLLLAQAKQQSERDNMILEWNLDNGLAEVKDGQIVPVQPEGQEIEELEAGDTGFSTIVVPKDNRKLFISGNEKQSTQYFDVWLNTIKNGINTGEIKKSDLAYLMGQPTSAADKIWNKYVNQADDKASKNALIEKLLLSAKIFDLKKRMDIWSDKHSALSTATTYLSDGAKARYSLDKTKASYRLHIDIKKQNDNKIKNALYTALSQADLSEKSKYSIVDAYIKNYRTRKLYYDEDFDDFVNDWLDKNEKKSGATKVDWKSVDPRTAQYATPTKVKGQTSFAKLLNDAYDKITSNPNHKVGLLSYRNTEVTSQDGQATIGARPTSVAVTFGRKDDNLTMFNQFVSDLKSLNFTNDPDNYRVSTKGNVLEKDFEVSDPDKIRKMKSLMFDLQQLSKQKGQKDKPDVIKLVQHPVAMENPDLGAMSVKNIPLNMIEKYFKGDDKTIAEIQANGITFMAPEKSWNNSLFQSNKITPFEMSLNTGKSIQYVDPLYGHKLIVTRDKVTGTYSLTKQLNSVDESGNSVVESSSQIIRPFGNNIDAQIEKTVDEFANWSKTMEGNFKYFQQSNNTEAVQKMQSAFGKTIKNSGFKIL